MILGFAVLYTFHNGSCICKTAGNADFYINSFIRNCEFFDTFFSTNTALCDFIHGLLGMIRIQTTENCLCNTTGNTKDYTTAGTKSKRHITCLRIQRWKIKTEVIDHTKQFGSRNNDIRIFLSVCIAVRPNCFCFLCSTWHNRNHDCLLSCCMLRITEIFFDDCRQHSLWGSAGRKIRNKFLILVSDEFYPCRTTGCQKRKFFSFFNSVKKLC